MALVIDAVLARLINMKLSDGAGLVVIKECLEVSMIRFTSIRNSQLKYSSDKSNKF